MKVNRLFKWLLTFAYNFHPLAKIEFPCQFVSFLLVDRGIQQPLAKVGTLKRKQQMRNFLEQMPKDNHDDIFASSPFQNKNTKVNIMYAVHIRISLPGIHQKGLIKHGRNDHKQAGKLFSWAWMVRNKFILDFVLVFRNTFIGIMAYVQILRSVQNVYPYNRHFLKYLASIGILAVAESYKYTDSCRQLVEGTKERKYRKIVPLYYFTLFF